MGPRFDERGKAEVERGQAGGQLASMGPRFDERGKKAAGQIRRMARMRFNGAALR